MKSHKARIICFQLTILISFIFLTQAVGAEKGEDEKHVKYFNGTNMTIINRENPTKDPKVIKDELFALKGITELPAHTKVFFYNVDEGIFYSPEAIDERDKIYFIFVETSQGEPPRYEISAKVKNLKPLPEETSRSRGTIPKITKDIPSMKGISSTEAIRRKLEAQGPQTCVTLIPVEESLEGRGKQYAIFELFTLKRSESDKEDKKEALTKFTFPIHEIYHFQWRLGFIYSTLNNPEYGVKDIFNPNTSQKERVLAITSKADTQFDPVLSLVIYPNGSDLRLDPDRKELKERFHWVVGFPVLSGRLFNNFFAGINYEFSRGADIIAGLRVGKVKKLSSNIVPHEPGTTGDPLPEDVTIDDISFKERWESSFSLAITFDTAVVTGLFTRLF